MDKTRKKTTAEELNMSDTSEDEQPRSKLAKLSATTNITTTAITAAAAATNQQQQQIDLSLNPSYVTKDFTHTLRTHWAARAKTDFKDSASGVEIYGDPFQICLLPALLQKTSCARLVDEMVDRVHWSRKQMDLYEFYQSTDLSNMADCRLLTGFLQLLRRQVRPWLERVTGLKLDYVSASCSMYTCGDYLLVHDDLLKDRQIAFVYYLSPWADAEEWRTEQGGCLEIFNADERCLPQFPVRRKISPRNNQFAFFKVGARSFHQVGEVTSFDYPRLTINGWFHGATNADQINAAVASETQRPCAQLELKPPLAAGSEAANLTAMLNEIYLKPSTRASIQKRIEDNSEICLYEFLRREFFGAALAQLLEDETLRWRRQGPANAHNYEVLEYASASATLAQLLTLFGSAEMFALLRDYTDLDLAGDAAVAPTCSVELQRWSHGNYTVLGDGAICEENTLDLIFYLNAAEGAAVITYLSPESEEPGAAASAETDDDGDEDESVLLTITPVDNALNVVYRCEGTTKFTKYVSRNTPLEKGPVFVISCSYKE